MISSRRVRAIIFRSLFLACFIFGHLWKGKEVPNNGKGQSVSVTLKGIGGGGGELP
jgi:hypothetical protein